MPLTLGREQRYPSTSPQNLPGVVRMSRAVIRHTMTQGKTGADSSTAVVIANKEVTYIVPQARLSCHEGLPHSPGIKAGSKQR